MFAGLGPLAAADPTSFLPAIRIEHVQLADAAAYVSAVTEINVAMKTRHGVPLFLRIYAGDVTGESPAPFFVLSPAGSFVQLQQNTDAFAADVALAESRARMLAAGSPVARSLLKCVRFDGTHAPGWLFNTDAVVVDEAGFLGAVAELRARFDELDLVDARLNVFRIIAGRTEATHLFSINTPSADRLALVLDVLADNPAVRRWAEDAVRWHTVVRNATFHELTP